LFVSIGWLKKGHLAYGAKLILQVVRGFFLPLPVSLLFTCLEQHQAASILQTGSSSKKKKGYAICIHAFSGYWTPIILINY
jgi:hypothetical protein